MSVSHYGYEGNLYCVEFHVFEDNSIQIEGVWLVEDESEEENGIPIYPEPWFEQYLISQIQMEDRFC